MEINSVYRIAAGLEQVWQSRVLGSVGNSAIKVIKMGGEGIAAEAHQVQSNRAIQQTGVHVRQAIMFGERPGDRPLPACRWSIDRDHQRLGRSF